jgi:glycerol uptake facilitator-like aquaporin
MDYIFAIIIYSLAELICFFVGIILGITCYYNELRFHNIYEYSLLIKQFIREFLAFILAKGLVGCLIRLCKRQKFKSKLTLAQLIIRLLVLILLVGLICEVCMIYPPARSY